MFILNEGRSAFLEFLRNLTPQILLLSLSFFLGEKLNFSKIDFNNFTVTFIFYVFLFLAILAGWANASMFMGKFVPMERVRRAMKLIGKREKYNRTRMRVTYAARKKMVFFEGILMIVTVEFSLAGVFISAIAAANKMSI